MKLIRLIWLVTLQLLFLKEISSQYEIILDRFEALLGDDDQIFENIDMRVKKFNRTQYVAHGVHRMKMSANNSYKVGFKAFNRSGGQYKLLFGRLLGPWCDMMYEDHMRQSVEEYFSSTNLSSWHWKMCPIPANYIFVNNYFPTQLGNYLPHYIPGGEQWKLSLYVTDENETIIGGLSIYAILRSEYSLLTYGG